jgi:hypothetical protein
MTWQLAAHLVAIVLLLGIIGLNLATYLKGRGW